MKYSQDVLLKVSFYFFIIFSINYCLLAKDESTSFGDWLKKNRDYNREVLVSGDASTQVLKDSVSDLTGMGGLGVRLNSEWLKLGVLFNTSLEKEIKSAKKKDFGRAILNPDVANFYFSADAAFILKQIGTHNPYVDLLFPLARIQSTHQTWTPTNDPTQSEEVGLFGLDIGGGINCDVNFNENLLRIFMELSFAYKTVTIDNDSLKNLTINSENTKFCGMNIAFGLNLNQISLRYVRSIMSGEVEGLSDGRNILKVGFTGQIFKYPIKKGKRISGIEKDNKELEDKMDIAKELKNIMKELKNQIKQVNKKKEEDQKDLINSFNEKWNSASELLDRLKEKMEEGVKEEE